MCERDLVAMIDKYLLPRYCSRNTVYTSILQPAPGVGASNNTGTRSRSANCVPGFLFVRPDAMGGFGEKNIRRDGRLCFPTYVIWKCVSHEMVLPGRFKSARLRWTEHVARTGDLHHVLCLGHTFVNILSRNIVTIGVFWIYNRI
jgi:hypothetical protein